MSRTDKATPDSSPSCGPPSCWILSDGTAGMETQAIGLAHAIGLAPQVKRIRPAWWLRLAPQLGGIAWSPAAARGSDALAPPYPDITISCGRRHAGAAIALKRHSGGRIFAIHIQDPRISPQHFDLLIVPDHDPVRGVNVLTSTGSLNRIDDAGLAEARAGLAAQYVDLPRPVVAVLVGGSTKQGRVEAAEAQQLAGRLAALAEGEGCGLAVCLSRRSGTALTAALRGLAGRANTIVWASEEDGPNPYPGLLGLADHLIVTTDSINMMSEACSTGKPVHLLPLGPESRRRQLFRDALVARGLARPLSLPLQTWPCERLRETDRLGALAAARLREYGIRV